MLGPFEVRDGDRLMTLGGPRERAVLALLALQPGRAVPVDRIIDVLWSESPPKTALKTLQTYVSRLRRSVGESLRTVGAGYALEVSPHDVDAVTFATGIDAGRRLAEDGRAAVALDLIESALAQWRSEPLAEFSFSAALAAEATRLTELRVAGREAAVRARLALGRHDEAVPELASLLDDHPLRESLWHDLIVALYRSGRQADALRAFQRARRTLVDELGIEPGPELRDLERRVLAQDRSLDLPKSQPAPVGSAVGDDARIPAPLAAFDGAPFVGRAEDEAELFQAWEVVARGGFAIELLAGEPGIGKSMLAGRVASACAAAGGTVLYGRCDEEHLVPYQPFVEAIRHYVRPVRPEVADAFRAAAGEAVRLIPELREASPTPSMAWTSAEAPDRLALFEGVVALLRLAGEQRPCVLVIDDLHWADAGTLLLLRYLVGTSDVPQLLVLATYRDTELRRDHPLAETLSLLRRDRRVTRRLVQPLRESAVADLVAGSASLEAAEVERFACLVHAETGGNPLFVQELVRHLDESSWAADHHGIPEGVRDVIGRRLARLSNVTNATLMTAAVLGQHFDARVLAMASDQPSDDVVEHLEEARAAGLVTEDRESTFRYSFGHAIVRATLYEELGPSRRVRAHQAAAAAYEAMQEGGAPRLAAIAHHLIEAAQAQDAGRAATFARAAGRVALAQLAFEDAAASFRQALDVLELATTPDAELRAVLLLDLGRALLPVDQPEATAILWRAADSAAALGLAATVADAAMELVGLRPHAGAGDPPVQLLERAIRALGPSGDAAVRTRAEARLVTASSSFGSRQELLEASGRTLTFARDVDDEVTLGEALIARLFTLTLPTDADERLALSGELLRLGRAAGHGGFVLHAHRFRIAAFLERGDADAAWREAVLHRELAHRRRDVLQIESAGNIAISEAIGHGRFDDVAALFDDLAGIHHQAGLAAVSDMVLHSHRIVLAWIRGDELDAGLASTKLPPPTSTAVEALFHALAGRRVEALAAAAPLLAAPSLPETWAWAGNVFLLATVAEMVGDLALIARARGELEPHAGSCLAMNGRTFFGAVDHHRGRLAAAEGDAALGRELLQRAIEQYERMALPAWRDRALADLADLG